MKRPIPARPLHPDRERQTDVFSDGGVNLPGCDTTVDSSRSSLSRDRDYGIIDL